MIDRIVKDTGCGVRRVCAVLQVPRSSYYHAATPSGSARSDQLIGALIETIFKHHRRRYGYRRIRQDLADQGHVCSAGRVRRLMRERGLKAIQPRTYTPHTSDGRADKPSANLLLDQPLPTQPDEVWAGDITFIPSERGWLYLAVVIDLCIRKIIGWALAEHMRCELVVQALEQAIGSRPRHRQAIFHSDRGSQYGSSAYRAQLSRAGLRQSMSARANPYHNAWTESFMGTLKAEMLQGGSFIDAEDARTELFAYIDAYYNTHRKHSSLGYKSPSQFGANLHSRN